MPDRPLTAEELEERLEDDLDPVLSTRRTAEGPALALARFTRAQQNFVLHWVSVIVKTNSEMGFQFASQVPIALDLMDIEEVEKWIIHAMDVYDKQGLYPGSRAFQAVEQYSCALSERVVGIGFEEVEVVLERFLRGLSGRPLKLIAGDRVFTDSERIFLPACLASLGSPGRNFSLYKAMASFLWAQTRYGTFRRGAEEPTALSARCDAYPQPERAQRLFEALEAIRLTACIERDLSGLYREMMSLQRELGQIVHPSSWSGALHRLRRRNATVRDSFEFLSELYSATDQIPQPYCFQGRMQLEAVESAMQERQLREKEKFRVALKRLVDGQPDTPVGVAQRSRLEMDQRPLEVLNEQGSKVLTVDGQPLIPPADMQALMRSIWQDFGEIPEAYLVPAGSAPYWVDNGGEGRFREDLVDGPRDDNAYVYNEWDYRRGHYRKDWCVLRETDVHPSDESFVEDTLTRYSALVGQLRRTFEALRGEDRLLKRQIDGSDIDLDAVVEASADMRAGMEMSERIFTKFNKSERNMAAVFMVDMSGSTKGWINDAEREALVLLCEALEVLGDRYAIYGFSGITRKQCCLYRIKRFGESYDNGVKRRITGIRPHDYTRMGVIIRHLTGLLRHIDARTKLLVTLSDGKPDDYDGYRGEYGVEDTRQALIEAKYEGVHPFCITIDTEAHAYLPRMYGAVNYVVIDEVRKLPLKVADIYRSLTS